MHGTMAESPETTEDAGRFQNNIKYKQYNLGSNDRGLRFKKTMPEI